MNTKSNSAVALLPPLAGSPPLDCSREELVEYIRSMKGGERVQEMGGSCMTGMKGTVEIRDGSVCIRWDRHEYADGAGVMVTSFTGGARMIEENAEVSHAAPPAASNTEPAQRGGVALH